MKVTLTETEITITLPISPRTSGSGKSLVIASTGGNLPTTATYNGKVVICGVNCYVSK
jgi:hypothetical protein